ncbi:MAG: XdhC family protein [Acidimicrobiales bacterium]
MDAAGPDREVVMELARRLDRSEDVVLATALRTEGSPPCRPGQKLLIGAGGPLAGTLGCSELDAQALTDAPGVISGAQPALRTYDHDLGRVEVHLEPYLGRPLLVVLGATPVAGWLLRWGADLGYQTALVEPRAGRVTAELAALAGTVAGSPEPGGAGRRAVDAVHTDHDAPEVAAHLAQLLRAGARFVGVMGSARHVGHHLEELRTLGLGEDEIARVRSPVGIDVGARTPAEIALSILAGLVAARTGREGGWLDRR